MSDKMTPVEGLKIFGLKAGKKYPHEEFNQAVRRAKLRAQHTAQLGETDKAQDDAIETLVRITEAERVLQRFKSGGIFYVPPAPAGSSSASSTQPSSPVRRAKKPAQSGKSPAKAKAFGPQMGLSPLRKAVAAVMRSLGSVPRSAVAKEMVVVAKKLILIMWLLLKAPFSLLRRKEYVSAALTTVFVFLVAWFTVGFITGGAIESSSDIRKAVSGFHQFMVGWIRDEEPEEKVEIKGSHLEKLTVEINGEELSGSQIVRSGSHSVSIHSGESVLFSGELHFPHSGQVEIEEVRDGGIALKIQWKGGVKWLALNTSNNRL